MEEFKLLSAKSTRFHLKWVVNIKHVKDNSSFKKAKFRLADTLLEVKAQVIEEVGSGLNYPFLSESRYFQQLEHTKEHLDCY